MWGDVVGAGVEYREATLDEFKKKFPVDGEELLSASYSAEFGYAGKEPNVLHPGDLGLRESPERIRRWMSEQDWGVVTDAEVLYDI